MFKKKLALALLIAICVSQATAETCKPLSRAEALAEARRKSAVRARAAAEKEKQKEKQYENTSVLVETFLVRVSKHALKEAGVNPIGMAPDGISIPKLLWCLRDSDKAKVISEMKLATKHNERSSIKIKKIFHFDRKTGNHKSLIFDLTKSLEAYTRVLSEDEISVNINCDDFYLDNVDSSLPPDREHIFWSGNIIVKPGVPVIAAAMQADDENINFIVLTATIQNQTPPKAATEFTDVMMMATDTAVEEVAPVQTPAPKKPERTMPASENAAEDRDEPAKAESDTKQQPCQN